MKMKHWMLIAAVLATNCLTQDAFADDQLDAPKSDKDAATPFPRKTTRKTAGKTGTATGKKTAAKVTTAPMEPAVAPAKGETAVPRQNNVNIRGQANLNSEVVTKMKKDDQVKILDEVTRAAKGDEPSKWYKVSLPASTPVWVNTSFIDHETKAVKSSKLNLRSGPGENYSVIGRVPKGTVLKTLETKGEWTKVEAPDEAFGFVAAHLLTKQSTPVIPPPAVAVTPPPVIVPPVVAPPVVTPPVAPPPVVPPTVAVVPPAPVVTPPAEIVAPPPLAVTPPAPVAPPPIAPPVVVPPVTPAEAPSALIKGIESPEEPAGKRIVTREGIVRRSVSIQAPSYFVLESLTGKPIDYLHSSSTNVSLKDFKGKHILVTGEELLDERWPHTPVIDVDTLEPIDEPAAVPAPTDGNK